VAVSLQLAEALTAVSGLEDVMTVLKNFVRDENGADLIEYAFTAGLIAFGCVVAMGALSGSLNGFFTKVTTTLDGMLP
jgi:pilus assembly protein Flp/PilA